MVIDHFRAETLSILHLVLIDTPPPGLSPFPDFTYVITTPAKDVGTLPGIPGQEVTQPGSLPGPHGLGTLRSRDAMRARRP